MCFCVGDDLGAQIFVGTSQGEQRPDLLLAGFSLLRRKEVYRLARM